MSPTEKQAALPHHTLIAYQLALGLVQLVARTRHSEAHAPSFESSATPKAVTALGMIGDHQNYPG